MAIALKEANETEYWILLLRETKYLSAQESESILADTTELLKLLTSIIKSAKGKWQWTMDNGQLKMGSLFIDNCPFSTVLITNLV